jgi:hypothetical protein
MSKPIPKQKPHRIAIELPTAGYEERGQREVDEQIDPDDMAMEAAVRGMAEGERYVRLYRQNPKGGKPKFLAHIIIEEWNEGVVQERFGGGSYFGRWQKADGKWMRYPFEIEGPPKVIEEEPDEGQTDSGYHVPQVLDAPNGQMSTADIFRLVSETRREAREEMRMLLELMKAPPAPPAPTEQVFSLVEKIVPLIQGGGGGEQNPWLFAISQLKEPLAKIVDTVHAVATQPVVRPPVKATVPPVPPSPTPPVVQAEEPDMILTGLKQYLPMLQSAGQKGSDPALYADLILDQIPPMAYPALRAWLTQAGCLDKIAAIDPSIRQQAPWWESLRAALLEALSEDATDAVRPIQPSPYSDPPTESAPAGDSAY